MNYLLIGVGLCGVGALFVALGLCRAAKIGDEGNALARERKDGDA